MADLQSLLEKLVNLGERQLDCENAAAEMLCAYLRERKLEHQVQTYAVSIPKARSAELVANGKPLPCVATCFSSGVIPGKDVILSSAMAMAESPDLPNINVNPYCPAISRGNHYRKPAVAVSHETFMRILEAKTVRGEVDVEIVEHEAHNIVLGNAENPQTVLFTHYDSVGPGANDNVSGVISTLQTIEDDPSILKTTIVIISGAEELSTDTPYYWGAGYRRFQDKSPQLLQRAKQILVVDSVGQGPVQVLTDPRIIRRGFPINNLEALALKTRMITADLDALMTVYHSELDTAEKLSKESMERATDSVVRCCRKSL